MSSFAKITLAVLVVGLIGWGTWAYTHRFEKRDAAVQDAATPTLTSGSTNNDLDRDMETIDSQLKLISDTSSAIDESMTNKPVSE